jgi:hypothetical protein
VQNEMAVNIAPHRNQVGFLSLTRGSRPLLGLFQRFLDRCDDAIPFVKLPVHSELANVLGRPFC